MGTCRRGSSKPLDKLMAIRQQLKDLWRVHSVKHDGLICLTTKVVDVRNGSNDARLRQ